MAFGKVNVSGKYNINNYIHYSSLDADSLITQKSLSGFESVIIDKQDNCIWGSIGPLSANTAMRNSLVKLDIEDFSQLSFNIYYYSSNNNIIDKIYAHKYNLFVIRRSSATYALWLVDKNDYSETKIVLDVGSGNNHKIIQEKVGADIYSVVSYKYLSSGYHKVACFKNGVQLWEHYNQTASSWGTYNTTYPAKPLCITPDGYIISLYREIISPDITQLRLEFFNIETKVKNTTKTIDVIKNKVHIFPGVDKSSMDLSNVGYVFADSNGIFLINIESANKYYFTKINYDKTLAFESEISDLRNEITLENEVYKIEDNKIIIGNKVLSLLNGQELEVYPLVNKLHYKYKDSYNGGININSGSLEKKLEYLPILS